MKFTKGNWKNRKGIEIDTVMQVREVRIYDKRLYLYTVPYENNVPTVGGVMMELYISAPQPDIIRIEAHHHKGSNRKMPKFELNFSDVVPNITETEEEVSFESGDTKLVIKKRPCSFTYYHKDEQIASLATLSTVSVQNENIMNEQLDLELIGSSGTASRFNSFMRVQMDIDLGEKIYGLGECFTPLVKNGQSYTIWNEDGGTNSNLAYKCIPFYLTNRNYGMFVNDTGPVSFEVGSEHTARVQCSVPGEKIDFMIIGGSNMKDVIRRYTDLTGKPALLPAWTFGLWLTTSASSDYDQKKVMELVGGMKDRGVPLHVFMYDAFATKENEWCSFEWDRRIFPQIEQQLKELKADYNIHPSYWLNSYIAQKSPLFDEAMEKGYLLKRPNGDVWQWDEWQSGMGIVDFTNPDAYRWFQNKLRPLVEQGIESFKTDFGERIPTDIVYHDGSDPLRMHNYYTYLYNKCVFELLEECKGKNHACLFARSATAGGQKFPLHWSGDPRANYTDMALSLRGGLSLCLSGFAFWSHDIGGFDGCPTADLYKRWVAFGLLSTHSRLHGIVHKVPWLFSKEGEQNGEESVAVLKAFTELKCSLMPYLYAVAVNSHQTGLPSMRAMVLEFPEDMNCENLESQYMLGDRIMVAPVMNEQGTVTYYLPEGEWTHLLSNEVKAGGKWMREAYDYFSLPLFVRENSILAIGANKAQPEYDYTDGLTLHIFALKDTAQTVIYDTEGNLVLKAAAVRQGDTVTVTLDGIYRDLRICMRNVDSVYDVCGAVCENGEQGVMLKVTDHNVRFGL